jgi:hypothetical protein
MYVNIGGSRPGRYNVGIGIGILLHIGIDSYMVMAS